LQHNRDNRQQTTDNSATQQRSTTAQHNSATQQRNTTASSKAYTYAYTTTLRNKYSTPANMSDEEDYEYEYDDDADDDNGMQQDAGGDKNNQDNQFEYTDDEEDADDGEVALENAYYNSKGLRETDLVAAAASFEQVIELEHAELKKTGSSKSAGPWSFKAMKQLIKLHLRAGNADEMLKHYNRLLECIATGDASPAAIEKGVNGMLERVAALYQGSTNQHGADSSNSILMDPQKLALQVYDATLAVFQPETGACKNERLWFKTNMKYGQLLYEMNETAKLQQVLKDLKSLHPQDQTDNDDAMGGTASSSASSTGSSTQSLEIYALQIQLYSRQKDNKKLRETFTKAMAVRGGIPHPRTIALIQELGGKMHMAAREYEPAINTFFQAFKSYDEAGDPSRLRCLKYLVLASMLHASTINPFDSQEARPYRDDPEIVAMTNLVQAFHNNDVKSFERILRQNQGRIMEDEFVREHVEDLLRTIRTQVLRRVIRPYTRISLEAVARELNDIPVTNVESLLVSLILDGSLDAKIDRVTGVLLKQAERGSADTPAANAGVALVTKPGSETVQKCEAMDQLIQQLENFSAQVTSTRVKDSAMVMRGLVH
jgi:COP9 signalosome complex subunit 2